MQIPMKRMLNVQDAAQYLSIGRSSLYLRLKSGEIRSYKIGGRRVVDIIDLDKFIDSIKGEKNSQE